MNKKSKPTASTLPTQFELSQIAALVHPKVGNSHAVAAAMSIWNSAGAVLAKARAEGLNASQSGATRHLNKAGETMNDPALDKAIRTARRIVFDENESDDPAKVIMRSVNSHAMARSKDRFKHVKRLKNAWTKVFGPNADQAFQWWNRAVIDLFLERRLLNDRVRDAGYKRKSSRSTEGPIGNMSK